MPKRRSIDLTVKKQKKYTWWKYFFLTKSLKYWKLITITILLLKPFKDWKFYSSAGCECDVADVKRVQRLWSLVGSFWHFWFTILWNHSRSPPRNSSAQLNSQSSHKVPVWPLISTDDRKCSRKDQPPWFLIELTQEVKWLFVASHYTVDDRLLCI